ncbi:MAG: hypothetical protein ACOC6F_02355 [bacterium]
MAKYDNLSDKEREMLRRMGEAYKEEGTTSWTLVVTGGGSDLLATEGKSLDGVPHEKSFYLGLEGKGFLSTVRTSQNFLEISLQQPAIEYADYASRSWLTRWWKNRMYDLAENGAVWARIFWHIVTFALGFLCSILLRLLGWIKIGN